MEHNNIASISFTIFIFNVLNKLNSLKFININIPISVYINKLNFEIFTFESKLFLSINNNKILMIIEN
ncbi:hypothetical protein, partial [Paraclostridium sordellii]|uniref:hypothetical protein n=1 Tax=Paraclostridium sordellii TaxID=1505 RepID=UPI0022DFAE1F